MEISWSLDFELIIQLHQHNAHLFPWVGIAEPGEGIDLYEFAGSDKSAAAILELSCRSLHGADHFSMGSRRTAIPAAIRVTRSPEPSASPPKYFPWTRR